MCTRRKLNHDWPAKFSPSSEAKMARSSILIGRLVIMDCIMFLTYFNEKDVLW